MLVQLIIIKTLIKKAFYVIYEYGQEYKGNIYYSNGFNSIFDTFALSLKAAMELNYSALSKSAYSSVGKVRFWPEWY